MGPNTPTQTFTIRNTTTKSVTLYPTTVKVARVINGVDLLPGPNTVVITGITPTTDEHSIKVDGTGSATITDLRTELVDNPEVYLDVYPDEEDVNNVDLSDISDDEPEDEGRMKEIKERLEELNQKNNDEMEEHVAWATVKQACESYIRVERNYGQAGGETSRPQSFQDTVKSYIRERETAVKEITRLTKSVKDGQKEVAKLLKEQQRLTLEARRAELKKEKEEEKRQIREQRKRREQEKEKRRIHDERVRFWPKKVYKVTICLEAPEGFTPATSRRSSITSVGLVGNERDRSDTPIGEAKVNLTLSYISTSASWSPRYDLALSTITNNGQLDFSAELVNTTSESWSDTKITLSTSSSTYGGLGDEIPVLLPWHLKLQNQSTRRGSENDKALMAPCEIQAGKKQYETKVQEMQRYDMFGLEREYLEAPMFKSKVKNSAIPQASPMKSFLANQTQNNDQYQAQLSQQCEQLSATKSFGAAPSSSSYGLFGGSDAARGSGITPMAAAKARALRSNAAARPPLALMAARRAPATQSEHSEEDEDEIEYSDEEQGFGLYDDAAPTALKVEKSHFAESGLTTTYDLPGLKGLNPSSTKSKHKITKVEFRNIGYSHIIVPKLRAAAFLKARLKNLSKITLLKGDCGLTVDGTFLGHTSLPFCSRGDEFTLNLGSDPAVTVSYAMPTVRRGTTGSGLNVFGGNKENNEVFTRVTTISNTKSTGAALDLTLLEQIPVSEDERLKVHITEPKGLIVGGAQQWVGQPKDGGNSLQDKSSSVWGSATATAKKGGEVSYSVKINPGKGCKISLEYEILYPNGECVVSV